jgi:hypothetical protein
MYPPFLTMSIQHGIASDYIKLTLRKYMPINGAIPEDTAPIAEITKPLIDLGEHQSVQFEV